jgi:hypothetical protein
VVGVEIDVPPEVDVIPRFQIVPLDLVQQHTHFCSPLLKLSKSNLSSKRNNQSQRERERERERETQHLNAIALFA